MYAIETKNLIKKFDDFVAINDVSIQIKKGEIHAIVGENGAGKSTLMNMLFGLLQPTSGEIFYNGELKQFNSPKSAIENGLGMVHQHFKLVPSLKVYENVILGEELIDKYGVINNEEEIKNVQDTLKKFQFNIDVNSKVSDLPVGIQQQVEIIKMLHRDVDLLILDEPTAVLTPQETSELLERLVQLQRQGTTIIIITHKLDEVKKISNRVSIIRKGKFIGTVNSNEVSEQQLSRLMVGRDVITVKSEEHYKNNNDIAFEIKNLSYYHNNIWKLDEINMYVRKGEIVGIAGVDGNGQSELLSILTGMKKLTKGDIYLNGILLDKMSPSNLRESGLGLIPEDRYLHGLNKEMPIWANLIAGRFQEDNVLKKGFFDMNIIEEKCKRLIQKFDIRLSGNIHSNVSSLSGGNAQKIIMAREIDCNPEVIIMSQPTRGIDIGSIEYIHSEIIKLKNEGKAIILISSELNEVLNLSDRIYVIYKGKIMGERIKNKTSKEEIGDLMLGINSYKIEEGK
ncbi:ABC transporter ATP-binding protein [Tuanshanicoccus lijuaniae]|uniref:ABC transporter ATP-binding protein n=1 Tax=Aerococcaceae bacterium zg-1292 TaxID=2774330 RepID=UPI0019382A8C|nr:ABC transporter ATP-binding protein [Aerococcaceae bacterium zg-1292]QQA36614.1 ABC transporter ATP-binding protein [Aerococcaceae bacterium zg-1292]